MERLFRSLKTEWVPSTGYPSAPEAHRDISYYLMRRRRRRPAGRPASNAAKPECLKTARFRQCISAGACAPQSTDKSAAPCNMAFRQEK